VTGELRLDVAELDVDPALASAKRPRTLEHGVGRRTPILLVSSIVTRPA